MKRLCPFLLMLPLIAVSASAAVIYDNGVPLVANNGLEVTQAMVADDFNIAAGGSVVSVGAYFGTTRFPASLLDELWDGTLDYTIFADAVGAPGTAIVSGAGVNVSGTDTGVPWFFGGNVFLFEFDLQNPFAAAAGTTYWLGLHLASDYSTRQDIYWISGVGIGGNAHVGFEGPGAFEQYGGEFEQAFYLSGESMSSVPEPTTWLLFGTGLAALVIRRRKAQSN